MPTKPPWINDRLIDLAGVGTQHWPERALFVVATPIGNLADISLRALWVLAHVDAIAAEDTRVTRTLLQRFEIDTPLLAAHQHNEQAAAAHIVERLQAGARIALVTDAGTPGVSDPGAIVVRKVAAAGLPVVPVPGASSVLAALSAAGLADGTVSFRGFPPTGTQARAAWLEAAAQDGSAFVLLEAPHRVAATLGELAKLLAPQRRVIIARELTKRFETIVVTTAQELAAVLERLEPRGEYVLVVDTMPAEPRLRTIDAATRAWLVALARELPASRAAAVAAKATGLPRELLYAALGKSNGGKSNDVKDSGGKDGDETR
jgi:16S rRNA (cytidine1402-2'-O)-methyltransferase